MNSVFFKIPKIPVKTKKAAPIKEAAFIKLNQH